eukprot:scaffold3450_cov114-Cylindrotheca_fusiformis.AAC.43
MRPSNFPQDMTSPSFEALDESEDKSQQSEPSQDFHSRRRSKYPSTPNGDIVVVEPSFDESDGRGPAGDRNLGGPERRSSPLSEKKSRGVRGHERNLSEHFYDATTLSNEPTDGFRSYSIAAAGQKHRRGLSSDVSNPAEAHRRINSIGNSSSIRKQDFGQERQHQRVDSALDILTAAADVSREELAIAAGERVRGQRNPWEVQGRRRSPVEMVTYDHSTGDGQSLPSQPPGRHMPYPQPGPPPRPPYYGAPIQYHHPYPPPPPAYYSHPSHAYSSQIPAHQPTSGYPVQYSRGHDPYSKSAQVQQAAMNRPRNDLNRIQSSQHVGYPGKDVEEKTSEAACMTPPPPPPPPVSSSHYQRGTTQGVQTFVTSIGVNEGGRTFRPSGSHQKGTNSEVTEAPPVRGHHRKTSSISSLVFLGDNPENGETGHHRSTSSSVSFLQGLDVGLEGDAAFLHHLQASTGATASGYSTKQVAGETKALAQTQNPSKDDEHAQSKLASGGTSKRVRRKCTVDGCPNRVVQGGLCISHGAKRKQCKHPGCTKNVKKAGLCSTHGPARKRCEAGGCNKVAVQGGRCIAHGAKKKLCSVDACAKQAILGGMCKKHHDQNHHQTSRVVPPPVESFGQCREIESSSRSQPQPQVPQNKSNPSRKRTHTRGLSIFQEMSADTVGNLLLSNPDDSPNAPAPQRPGTTYNREFGIY